MIAPPTEPGFYWAIRNDRAGAKAEVVAWAAAPWGRKRLVVYVIANDVNAEVSQFDWLSFIPPPARDPA